jgi:hypothetical protein
VTPQTKKLMFLAGVFLFMVGLSITLSMVMIRSLGKTKVVADLFTDGNPLMIAAYILFGTAVAISIPHFASRK